MVHVPLPAAILGHTDLWIHCLPGARAGKLTFDLFPSIQLLGFKTTHRFLRPFFLVAYSILYATNNLSVFMYT